MKLFGIINEDISKIKKTLSKMESSFKYNKSKIESFYSENVGLSHLTINNTNLNQPLWNKQKDKCVIFSGYLLNDEIKTSPISYIIKSYEKEGLDFVKRLNGIFVFVIWDKKKRELIIVNDRYGIKPFYYHHDEDKFLFASEIKAIALSGIINKEINLEAWRDIFSFGFILGNKTPFKCIERLPPASILKFKDNRLNIKEYWNYDYIDKDNSSEHQLIDKGIIISKDTFLKETSGLKKIQILLSGGYDSRFIACGVKKYTSVLFDTYTDAFHGPKMKDVPLAKLVAKKLRVKNTLLSNEKDLYTKHFIDLVYLLDGTTYEHLGSIPIISKLRGEYPVFDGLAGDILLKGLYSQDKFDLNPLQKSKRIYERFNWVNREINSFFNGKYFDILKPSKKQVFNELIKIKNIRNNSTIFCIKSRTKNSISLISSNLISRRTDIRFPFLENGFVKYSLSINSKTKIDNHIYLNILKRDFPNIMKIPTTNDESFFEKIIKKILENYFFLKLFNKIKNKRHPPLLAYPLNFEDTNFIISLLSNLETPLMINKEYLSFKIDEHLKKGKNLGYFLVPLANFILWYNLFILEIPIEEIKKIASTPYSTTNHKPNRTPH